MRDSRSEAAIKIFDNPTKHLYADINATQMNAYSWAQMAASMWDISNNYGIYTSLSITKQGVTIWLEFDQSISIFIKSSKHNSTMEI